MKSKTPYWIKYAGWGLFVGLGISCFSIPFGFSLAEILALLKLNSVFPKSILYCDGGCFVTFPFGFIVVILLCGFIGAILGYFKDLRMKGV